MLDATILTAFVLIVGATIWHYERRVLQLEELLDIQLMEPEPEAHAHQAMSRATERRIDVLLDEYHGQMLRRPQLVKPTDTINDEYTEAYVNRPRVGWNSKW